MSVIGQGIEEQIGKAMARQMLGKVAAAGEHETFRIYAARLRLAV